MPSTPVLKFDEFEDLFMESPIEDFLHEEAAIFKESGDNLPTSSYHDIPFSVYINKFKRREYIEEGLFQKDIEKLCSKIEHDYNTKCISFYCDRVNCQFLNDCAEFETAQSNFIEYLSQYDPKLFEYVCAYILHINSYYDVHVTKQTADGGLDFVGKHDITIGRSNQSMFTIQVFGQAKRYNKPVGIGDIRDFLGATELLRYGVYHKTSRTLNQGRTRLPAAKPFGSHGRLMIASNKFYKEAQNFSESAGIRCIDGKDLASIFHHHQIGFVRSRNSVSFAKDIFDNRISKWKDEHTELQ